MVQVACARCKNAFDAGAGGTVACPRCGHWQTAGAPVGVRPSPQTFPAPASWEAAAASSARLGTTVTGCFLIAGGVWVGLAYLMDEPPAVFDLLGGVLLLVGLITLRVGAKSVPGPQVILTSLAIGVLVLARVFGAVSDRLMETAVDAEGFRSGMMAALGHDTLLVAAVALSLWGLGRTLERSLLLTALVGGLALGIMLYVQFDSALARGTFESDVQPLLWANVLVQVVPVGIAAVTCGALLRQRLGAPRPQPPAPTWAAPPMPAPPRAPATIKMQPKPGAPRLAPQPAKPPAIRKAPAPVRPAAGPKGPAPPR